MSIRSQVEVHIMGGVPQSLGLERKERKGINFKWPEESL